MKKHKRRVRTAKDFALIGRVWAEVGSGRITEAFIEHPKVFVDGLCSGAGHITINTTHQTLDTVIHECLHRAFPHWGESYVRRTTTRIRRLMSDHETRAMYEEFQRRSRKRKRTVKAED